MQAGVLQHYDTDAMGASNLLIPLMGFLPIDDPRIASTVQRIRQEFGSEPLLRRYRTDETDDGLTGNEGAFTLCGFCLV
jgi:GH15 family glucan-1,4-alpha-glucosidase